MRRKGMTQKKPTKKADEVLVIDQDQQITPAMVISQAISSGSNLDQIEKLLEIQIKYEENEAKKAYTVAMAAFKANPPKIIKDKEVDFQPQGKARVNYKHADLAKAAEEINKALSEHGLSAAWIPSQEEKLVKVKCTITHKMGHSESCTLQAAPDATGNKNSIQQVGSTITYLERYTLLALTGLATHSQDDDGRGSSAPGVQYISEKQSNTLDALIKDNISDPKYMGRFLAYMKVETMDDILAKDFGKAQAAIKAAINQAKKQ
jgi:hypothetical protein